MIVNTGITLSDEERQQYLLILCKLQNFQRILKGVKLNDKGAEFASELFKVIKKEEFDFFESIKIKYKLNLENIIIAGPYILEKEGIHSNCPVNMCEFCSDFKG